MKNKEKGVFLLVKTSNASGRDIQDLDNDGETVYMRMARLTARWGEQFMGACGFSSIGAVTGLTYPDEFAAMKTLMPHVFLLIPGYGAQGGTGKDIGAFFKGGVRGVVNSSRGLLKAHAGKTDKDDFDQYIRDAALFMREDILTNIEA
jgi:orotidine-5'-phosphate decarboxylase